MLILIPLVLSIQRKQKTITDCLEQTGEAIASFNETASKMQEYIMLNFKEVLSKSVVIDSKQVSINDMLKDITQGLEVYHTKTVDAIVGKTAPNKTRRSNKPKNKVVTPSLGNSSAGSRI